MESTLGVNMRSIVTKKLIKLMIRLFINLKLTKPTKTLTLPRNGTRLNGLSYHLTGMTVGIAILLLISCWQTRQLNGWSLCSSV